MKEGRKPECPEKTPDDELQKMSRKSLNRSKAYDCLRLRDKIIVLLLVL